MPKIPFMRDPNKSFAYDTVKVVRVLDWRLGFTHYAFMAFFLVYVFVYVFGISKKFLSEEKVQGWVVIQVRNPQFSDTGIPWDLYDRWINPGEQGAVFIPTRVLITKGQTQNDEFCESPLHRCTEASDCDIRNDNVQKADCVNGHCMRRQWCPAEDPNSVTTETHYLEFDRVELRFQTYTHFHKFGMYMSTSDEKEWVQYPKEVANTYRLVDLVTWTGVEAEDIMEDGAVMMVNIKLDSPTPLGTERIVNQELEAHHIDTIAGYNFAHNHYYYEGGVRKRDTYRMFGLRIMAFATGFAQKISVSGIVIQVSSAFALMGLAEGLTDLVLMKCIPERDHYKQFRIKRTEDFNED